MTWLPCEESVKNMGVPSIQTTQQNSNVYKRAGIASVLGAAAGMGARYIVPTKNELSSMFNKEAVDTFVSSSATAARGASRSILKYGAIGALVATGIALLTKVLGGQKQNDSASYSKLGALIDAPDYAVEVMWYGE